MVHIVKMRIATDDLNLILVGGESSGKTTLTNNIVKEYHADVYSSTTHTKAEANALVNGNIMHISTLKDQGTLFCRNELKIFCQVKSEHRRTQRSYASTTSTT